MQFVDAFGDGGFVRTDDRRDRSRHRFTELFRGGAWFVGRGTARRAPAVGIRAPTVGMVRDPNDPVDVIGHDNDFILK